MAEASGDAPAPDQTKSVRGWQLDVTKLGSDPGPSHVELFGLDGQQADWCLEPAKDHVVPEDRAVLNAGLAAALGTGTFDIDVRVAWPNGDVRWLAVRGQILYGLDGKPSNAFGATVDVTVLRRQRAAQAASRDRHRFLLALSDELRHLESEQEIARLSASLISEHVGADRCFFYRFYEGEDRMTVGPGYARGDLAPLEGDVKRSDFPELLVPLEEGPFIVEDVSAHAGFSEERTAGLLSVGIASFVAVPLDKGPNNPVWGIAVSTSAPRVWDPYEVDMLTDAAGRIWPAVERARALAAMRASQGELELANAELERLNRGLGQVVAERTEELGRSEVRFKQAFELGSVAACITDESGETLIEVNRAFVRLTGHPADRAQGSTIERLSLWPDGRDRDRLEAAHAKGERFDDLELRLRARDGTVRDVLASGDRIRINGSFGWLLNFLDVTDRKRSQEELLRAIQEVMSDTNWFSQRLIERLAQAQGTGEPLETGETLSDREHQVLTRVSRGMTNEEIAEDLKISSRTVRNHVANIYAKIDVHSRAEAVVWARERGLTN